MGIGTILLAYQARLATLHSSTSQLRLGQMIALIVVSLSIFAILVLAFLAITRRTFPLLYALLPLPLAIYSVRLHQRRSASLLQSLRLIDSYDRGIARLEDKWAGSGQSGTEFKIFDHCFESDLNLLGNGSLFELLCTCRTEIGRRRLADCILEPPDLQEALRRQEAIKELSPMIELRDRIALLGDFAFQQTTSNGIVEWLELPTRTSRLSLQIVAILSSLSLALLLLSGASAVLAWSSLSLWISLLLLFHTAAGLKYRSNVLSTLPAIRTVCSEIVVLRQGLQLLQQQHFDSPLLKQLVLSATKGDPVRHLRTLERLMGALSERNKEWFYAISRMLLAGTQLFWWIEGWKAKHNEAMRRWLDVWGEFEVLMALANYAYEHPQNNYPRLLEERTALEAQQIGHSLLPAAICVGNDLSLNEGTSFFVISGSNMSGKSTLLRAVGLNAVLAYIGAPVCAKQLALSRFSICASISIQDSLLNGKSKFLAEIDRLALTLRIAGEETRTLFLIDEILSGTNSKDRRIAAEAILTTLIKSGSLGLLSTHDLALTELAELPGLSGGNVHMGSKDSSNPLTFDYLLKPGVTTESSALAIARLAGVKV